LFVNARFLVPRSRRSSAGPALSRRSRSREGGLFSKRKRARRERERERTFEEGALLFFFLSLADDQQQHLSSPPLFSL
jgi:hypothetical protein